MSTAAISLLLLPSCGPVADCGPYIRANTLLEQADAQLGAGSLNKANQLLLRGIEELGYAYLGDDVLDDSGLHLSLADYQQMHGQFELAVKQRQRVLSGRLDQFLYLHKSCQP